jgi:hypothetical protein
LRVAPFSCVKANGGRYVHSGADSIKKAAQSHTVIIYEPKPTLSHDLTLENDRAKRELALKLAMGQIDGETFKFAMSALGCSPTLEALR